MRVKKLSAKNTVNDKIRLIYEKLFRNGDAKSLLTVDEVCAAIKEKGDYKGSYEELVKSVRLFFGEMSHQLSSDFAVNTGYFSVHPVEDGSLKNKKHRLAQSVIIRVKEQTERGYIEYFTDLATGMVNDRVTPGGKFIVTGEKIKIEGNNPDCGVWFVLMVDTSQRFKVTKPFTENLSGKVSGIVPVIPAGKYSIEIKTQFNIDGVKLKEPKTIKGGFVLRNYKILSIKDEEEWHRTKNK